MSAARTCLVGFEDCDCDVQEDGSLASYCECHDCYHCGEIHGAERCPAYPAVAP